ncbi:proprotein convertase P-domain-containing protein [Lysobacter sp. KIS68-7]|uniref:TcdA/TcdB pore-forming domain-containing protein n=1 Tax=Lysobacter sp. KIS68-7 TaxID=2904252 RepID=UPI001E62E428|nr:TcdA/TcdB pore-forming domain-containing protein [Lysobacter sp. KIS68-7]UHQ19140.1 proprotein convertase P-domain-containing protein [Lysobacter sp. KIS68-7]
MSFAFLRSSLCVRLCVVLLTIACVAGMPMLFGFPNSPTEIPTTRDPGKAHRYPTIQALLENAGPDTVILLHDIRRGTSSTAGRDARMASTAMLLAFAQQKGAKVLIIQRLGQGAATVPLANKLPDILLDALDMRNVLGAAGIAEPLLLGSSPVLRKELGTPRRSIQDRYLQNTRHLLIIGDGHDSETMVPTFEAAWSGINVYRNPLLDISDLPLDLLANYGAKYARRLDHVSNDSGAQKLALPGFLAEDPFLHYVPIGQIPGVTGQVPMNNRADVFREDGTPFPFIVSSSDTLERTHLGAMAPANQFDVQVFFVLSDGGFFETTESMYQVNAARAALIALPKTLFHYYGDLTSQLPESQYADTFHLLGLAANAAGKPLPNPATQWSALETGRVELQVDLHGGTEGDLGEYVVERMSPAQLGTAFLEHPDTGLAAASATSRKRIAHLSLRACGVRCQGDYQVGSAPGLSADEIAYAKALVRWLATRHVDVERVTIANVTVNDVFPAENGTPVTWFGVRDQTGRHLFSARESALLATSLAYDRATDTFTEDPDGVGDAVAVDAVAALPPARYTDVDTTSEGAVHPDVAEQAPSGSHVVGLAQTSRSGATVGVDIAGDVRPRLDASWDPGATAWDLVFGSTDATSTPDIMVTSADMYAIAMAMRPQGGPVVVVDTDPARIRGVQRVIQFARDAATPLEWAHRIGQDGLGLGPTELLKWLQTLSPASRTQLELFDSRPVRQAYARLRTRALLDQFIFHAADLATRDGGAVVNASLGRYPVSLIAMPSDEAFRAKGAQLGVRTSTTAYLRQLHHNYALLAGPETQLRLGRAGKFPHLVQGEQAVRDLYGLPGATASSTSPCTFNTGSCGASTDIDGNVIDSAHVAAARDRHGPHPVLDHLEEGLADRGPLHRWWSQVKEAFFEAADWVRTNVMGMLVQLGLTTPDTTSYAVDAAEAHASDPLVQRIEGEQLGTRYIAATRRLLQEANLHVDHWMPVLGTARATEEPAGASGREYRVQVMHEGTGETREVATRDATFAQTREFVERMHAQVHAEAASTPSGAHVTTLNTAFALMGLMHVLEGERTAARTGLPENLATSLQVQMYVSQAQMAVGVVQDVLQTVQLAREGLQVARQVSAVAGTDASLFARVMGMASRTMGAAASVLGAAMVGLDIYNLAHAQTAEQRAVFGTQLAVDTSFAALMTGAFVAEAAGAATASSVLGALATPLAGLGIGIVGLVQAYMAVAQDVDASAAKFDKFADLYPRPSWTWNEQNLPISHPSSPNMRRPYTWDDKTRTLSPVFGIATNRIDLRTRDSIGLRKTTTAESYIDRADKSRIGTPSFSGTRPLMTGGSQPTPDPNAPGIPILARTGIYNTGTLPIASDDQVEMLVLPATPASHFHSYDYQDLADANTRHVQEPGFMGYEVLRRMESIDWSQGFFLYDFDHNAIATILRHVQEDWLATTVEVILDEHVNVVAMPTFVIPKNTTWTPEQQADYRAANKEMTRHMAYRIEPSSRRAPVGIALQNDYGNVSLKAPPSGATTIWMLDARNLRTPDAVRVEVATRGAAETGVVWIDGQRVEVEGAAGLKAAAGEGIAETYVILPHGAWHVNFAKREIKSLDFLAPSDLVHGPDVHAALVRQGFNFRTDGFIEISTGSGPAHPLNGTLVKRYYEAVADETLLHAIDDRYPDARLVFGDAQEGLFHDPKTGRLHRVRRGEVLPTENYQIGFRTAPQEAQAKSHSVQRVQRVDGQTLLVLVSYVQRTPDYMKAAPASDNHVDDGASTLLVSYRLRHGLLEIVGISDHDWLSAWLEEADRASANGVAYTGFANFLSTLTDGRAIAIGLPNDLTPVEPRAAEWVAVHGRIRVDGKVESRPYWIHDASGRVLKPLWIKPDAACRAGQGAIEGFKARQAVPSAGCVIAHPNDPVWLGTFKGPANESPGAPMVDWIRFHSPSLKGVFGVRPYDTSGALTQFPRTELLALGDAITQTLATDAAPAGRDSAGLLWTYDGEGGMRLAGFGPTWLVARGPATWPAAVAEFAAAQPHSAQLPELRVDGVLDIDGNAIAAWFLPASKQWAFGPAGASFASIADDTRAFLRAVDGSLLEARLADAVPDVAEGRVFDGYRLRIPLQVRRIDDGVDGKLSSATPQRDAACTGVKLVHENGAVTCVGTSLQPRVLEWNWCGGALPNAALAGKDNEYIALSCRSPEVAGRTPTVARKGWLSPQGELVALPKDAALQDASVYRLLGFNHALREAYYFRPDHAVLYVADWTGATKRKTHLVDAQVLAQGLFVRLPSTGIAPGALPLIDGLRELGLGTDSERAMTYRIEPATNAHYPRIVVDMGAAPLGTWQQRTVELLYANASRATPQRVPGGWRLADGGHTLELRGTGGHKRLVFGDSRQSLDLATLRPVSFLELPEGYVSPDSSAPDALPFSDRHDIDGDGIADLAKVVRNGTLGRIEWHARKADGSLSDPAPTRSDTDVPLFDARWHRGFYSVEGVVQYCGITALGAHPNDVEFACHRLDAEGVHPRLKRTTFNTTWAGPAPATDADLLPWVRDLVDRGAYWAYDAPTSAFHTRFNGRTMECLGTSAGNCIATANLSLVNLHPDVDAKAQACSATSPPTWCTTGLARQNPKHVEGPWRNENNASNGFVYRIHEGDVECASYNGRNCLGGSVPIASLDPARLNPLRCGAPHRIQWGEPGYGNPIHWCERLRPGAQTVGSGTPVAPTATNLRITGTLQAGGVLRGDYDYADANGDAEGESAYQWYVSDPQTGAPVVVSGAKDRTFILRPQDRGANRKIWFNIERLRAATGSPRDAANMPIGASITGTVTGRAPTASDVALSGTFQPGGTVQATFAYRDADGDAPGLHTYRWYRAAPNSTTRTLIGSGTTPQRALVAADGGQVLFVEVVPLAQDGVAGTAVLSPASVVVGTNIPHYSNGSPVAIPDDGAWVTSTIAVEPHGTINLLTVDVRILHGARDDLEVQLITPWGATLSLHNRSGNGANLIQEFTDPQQAGKSQRGVWTLRVRDGHSGKTGTLERWGLRFQ